MGRGGLGPGPSLDASTPRRGGAQAWSGSRRHTLVSATGGVPPFINTKYYTIQFPRPSHRVLKPCPGDGRLATRLVMYGDKPTPPSRTPYRSLSAPKRLQRVPRWRLAGHAGDNCHQMMCRSVRFGGNGEGRQIRLRILAHDGLLLVRTGYNAKTLPRLTYRLHSPILCAALVSSNV